MQALQVMVASPTHLHWTAVAALARMPTLWVDAAQHAVRILMLHSSCALQLLSLADFGHGKRSPTWARRAAWSSALVVLVIVDKVETTELHVTTENSFLRRAAVLEASLLAMVQH